MKPLYILIVTFLMVPWVALASAVSSPDRTKAMEPGTFPPYFPAFSWDRIPVYQMFADSSRLLTDAEVAERQDPVQFD